jgi:hypothetical protein
MEVTRVELCLVELRRADQLDREERMPMSLLANGNRPRIEPATEVSGLFNPR